MGHWCGRSRLSCGCLSRDLDPCHNLSAQHPPTQERFLKRLWAGTSFLFVPQTIKPYCRMQTMDMLISFFVVAYHIGML